MESHAIELVKGAGTQGILLAELAQYMNETETKVLEVINSLSKNGQIKKVEEKHDGESMIRLFWQAQDDSEWDTLQGCPCFICPDINQCGAGQPTTPWLCVKLNTWIKEHLE